MVKSIRFLRDTLDTTCELSNLVTKSPKQDVMLQKIREDLELQSVKKYSGTTKETFTVSKAKNLNPPSPLNQCCKSRGREKIGHVLTTSNID